MDRVARLRRVLEMCWDRDTCAPGWRPGWSRLRPSQGQCAVTALVFQDLLGGSIVKATVEGSSHYWNRLDDGTEVDLTRDQYPPDTEIPSGQLVPRTYLMEHERSIQAGTPDRYRLLSQRVQALYDHVS